MVRRRALPPAPRAPRHVSLPSIKGVRPSGPAAVSGRSPPSSKHGHQAPKRSSSLVGGGGRRVRRGVGPPRGLAYGPSGHRCTGRPLSHGWSHDAALQERIHLSGAKCSMRACVMAVAQPACSSLPPRVHSLSSPLSLRPSLLATPTIARGLSAQCGPHRPAGLRFMAGWLHLHRQGAPACPM